jgi:drug/metabolite transporter (DMT)-like permease
MEAEGRDPTTIAPRVRVTPLGAGAVLVAVAGFSVTNIILKITQATALSFAFYRLWAGALVMWAVLALTGRRLSMDVVRRSVWGGVVFGFNVSLFFLALKATNVADVLVIQSLQPALILMVAGPLFGERVTRWDVWWTVVSVGGVVLVTVGSSGTPVWSLRGDVFAVGSLLCWTAYFLVSKHARKRVPATEYMAVVTTTAAVVVTPLALLSHQPLGALRWQDWGWLAVFLVAAQGGHLMLAWAHSQVDVSLSSLILLAQPIITVAAAWILLDEPLPGLAIAGGLVVILSVAAIVRRAARAVLGEDEATPEASPA